MRSIKARISAIFLLFPDLFFVFPFPVMKARSFALTGGIACGKSMAEKFFSEAGCRVLDADAVVRALESPGGAAVQPIASTFGEAMVAADGGIDRPRLAARVFKDAEARLSLEAVVLPLVRKALKQWLAEAPEGAISVFSAATLFEQGFDAGWEGIVCVMATEATQVRRLVALRGMDEASARARLAAQMVVAEKARRSDWILKNDTDDPLALKAQVDNLVTQWRAGLK